MDGSGSSFVFFVLVCSCFVLAHVCTVFMLGWAVIHRHHCRRRRHHQQRCYYSTTIRLTNATFSTCATRMRLEFSYFFFRRVRLFCDMAWVYVCAKFIHISLSINLQTHTRTHTTAR